MRAREVTSEYRTRTLSGETKESILRSTLAGDLDWSSFSPANSGLSRTIWVSEDETVSAIIVSGKVGVFTPWPETDSEVYGFDERIPYPDVDAWKKKNLRLIRALNHQRIGLKDFFQKATPVLAEMSNIRREESGLPMVVNCITRRGQHDVRVKVCTVHSHRYISGKTAEVSVRPNIEVVEGELSGRAAQAPGFSHGVKRR